MSHTLVTPFTTKEIHELIDQANETEETGTNFGGMTYEDGIKEALLWVMGQASDPLNG